MNTNDEAMEVDVAVSPNAEYDEAIRLFKTSNVFSILINDPYNMRILSAN